VHHGRECCISHGNSVQTHTDLYRKRFACTVQSAASAIESPATVFISKPLSRSLIRRKFPSDSDCMRKQRSMTRKRNYSPLTKWSGRKLFGFTINVKLTKTLIELLVSLFSSVHYSNSSGFVQWSIKKLRQGSWQMDRKRERARSWG
jgi:hypothetical protein